MTTTGPASPMTETERILREMFPDPDSQAHADLCFREAGRAADAQAEVDRDNLDRAATGRRILG